MTTWTLAFDESGTFEGTSAVRGTPETIALVVGGVLLPTDAATARTALRRPLEALCEHISVPYPPKASDLVQQRRFEELRRVRLEVGRILENHHGRWLFIVDSPPSEEDDKLSVYVRMISELVETAARLACRAECSVLDIVGTRRFVRMQDAPATILRDQGYAGNDAYIDTLSTGEIRESLRSLARDDRGLLPPWPALGTLQLDPTSAPSRLHPAFVMADIGCNTVRYCLSEDKQHGGILACLGSDDARTPPHAIVARQAIPAIRRVDRSLRHSPASLLPAARAVTWLRHGEAGESNAISTFAAPRTGATLAAAMLWDDAQDRLASHADQEPLAQDLAGTTCVDLGAKTADYDGTWAALETGWAGDGKLARTVRSATRDRFLSARLWRLVLECSNHRGDHRSARRAKSEFDKVLEQARSVELLAEQLVTQNLWVVSIQNQLPADPLVLGDTVDLLRRESQALEALADHVASTILPGATPPTIGPQPEEDALRLALGIAPTQWEVPDRERGRAYGTVARTHGFLEEWCAAAEMVVRARAFFADSAFDLVFNAHVLARIALEAHRCNGPQRCKDLLKPALALARIDDALDLTRLPASLESHSHVRFGLDLALRTLLWAPSCRLGPSEADWQAALTGDALFSVLRTQRTHPTELVARHAAEWLWPRQQSSALRWFDLSESICDAAPAGSTLHVFGMFTRDLRAQLRTGAFGTHAPNTPLNPTFEYR